MEAEFIIQHSSYIYIYKKKNSLPLQVDKMAWLICSFFFSAFVIILYYLRRRFGTSRDRSPPALPSLPIIGSLLSLKSDRPPHIFFQELQKKYGETYSLMMGSHNVIIVNSHHHAREVLLKKGKAFAGRPRTVSIKRMILMFF